MHDARYIKFFELFNEQEYYECHEVLEELWMEETTCPERAFYQGLIQTATAFYHLRNGNLAGARKLFETGLKYLSPYPEETMDFDLRGYREVCEEWLEKTRAKSLGREVEIDSEQFPTVGVPKV